MARAQFCIIYHAESVQLTVQYDLKTDLSLSPISTIFFPQIYFLNTNK